jgi:hypothetical protein
MEVLVKAPAGTSLEKVKEKIKKKAPGLLNSRASFSLSSQRQERNILVEKHIYILADNTG